ncbi:peptidylprolyl isomerase [Sphingopyxis italica]|uniref:peptidylprolyl isomerase n=1 Tax=Sphingopyxis italica TaxID=1129133 RepID=UPI0014390993|nr:peptidylprolyl isomerase [Sphingopyxis italica]
MKHLLLAAIAAASLILPAIASEPAPISSPGEIAAAAPASDWIAIAPSDLLVMDLAPDAKGPSTRSGPRRVVIQLMPAPFSQGWIGNIRKLAAAHWWDGTSINRVQDNYVVQWGDATEKKALPEGLAAVPESRYVESRFASAGVHAGAGGTERLLSVPVKTDAYSGLAGFWSGWPVAGAKEGHDVWPVHCYGTVGVGRNMSPDTGSGAELYAVIGHAPRHLDRNIAVVGRVISGIEHLSSLPRGTEALGFYKADAERTLITSIRIANELPAAEQPEFEYLSTESDSFARYADARANRRDPFFIRPAGGADICNIPVPVRAVAK